MTDSRGYTATVSGGGLLAGPPLSRSRTVHTFLDQWDPKSPWHDPYPWSAPLEDVRLKKK
jgi:hypothetical protein